MIQRAPTDYTGSYVAPCRFVVAVTHGWLNAGARVPRGGSRHTPPLSAAVLDRLDCYRVVSNYRSEDQSKPSDSRRALLNARAVEMAEAKARDLNEEVA